ncbi:anaphase-promoting complex, cyclosome, subunit 4-domain-containing protein [Xylariomycetidae sp. FL0641]|nr:anaphase-promoting complex, cyclosome, subunit 4-domain-containing protein [Xylariomycetidae sp. FL0641]
MSQPAELRLFSETRLDPKAQGDLLVCNPRIELFASAAGPKTLQIWRSNAQVVAKSSQRGERESIEAVRWKADGQFLAVGWSDGIVRLMGLESSKAVHQIAVCEPTTAKITHIGWAQNYAGRRAKSSPNPSTMTWEQLASQGLVADGNKSTLDLPRELTFLEIDTALPKVSPLPASGGSGDDMYVFTTRASLEFLFRPFSPTDSDKVDVMVVGTNDGRIHISIYDSFVIGTFNYKLPPRSGSCTLQLCNHASHPDLSTHMLIFRPSGEDKSKTVYLVPMDLTFVHSSPENLSLLASKTTTLQKLLRYVKQVQMHMVHEWQSTRELPNRFLNSINQTLRETEKYGELNIGQALYHSVVTGHTFPEVKEWLVDQLAERGHKRWDKAVISGLQTLRGLVHENMLPALERMGIILSRLLGIARFHESKAEIGFTSSQILKVMDTVSCLMLVGNKILLLVMEELELFHCFSGWLRHEIVRLASSSATDELTEKEATMEHGKVLVYIQQFLPSSPLRHYLSNVAAADSESSWQQADDGSSILDLLEKQIRKQEAGQDVHGAFPQAEFLCNYLDSKANTIFEGLAAAEMRSVRFGQNSKIEVEHKILMSDVRMSAVQTSTPIKGLTFLALTTEGEESTLYVFRSSTTVTNGISGSVTTEVTGLTLGDGKILDLKFLYDDSLLILLAPRAKPNVRLVRIPHGSEDLGYQPYKPKQAVSPHVLDNQQVETLFVNFAVPCEAGFVPTHMEIKEASSERGKLPPRVCLLGRDSQTYKVFALPDDLAST